MKYLKYFESDRKLYKEATDDLDQLKRIKSTTNIPFSDVDIRQVKRIINRVKSPDYKYGIIVYNEDADISIVIYELSKEHPNETTNEFRIRQFKDNWFIVRKIGGMHSEFMIDGWDGMTEVLTSISNPEKWWTKR